MWKRRKTQRGRATLVERARARLPPPPPQDHGPVRTALPDGTVEEISAATGRSVIVPGTPARSGLDLRADAPGWEGRTEFRRLLRGR
jgi:hypothetical protein